MFTAAKPTRLRAPAAKYAIWHHLDAGLQYITQSPGEGFEAAVEAALDGDKRIFESGGSQYLIDQTGSDSYDIYRYAIRKMLYVCSPYTVDLYSGADVPKDFLKTALIGFCRGGVFSFDGADYVISEELEDGESVINIYRAGEARLCSVHNLLGEPVTPARVVFCLSLRTMCGTRYRKCPSR